NELASGIKKRNFGDYSKLTTESTQYRHTLATTLVHCYCWLSIRHAKQFVSNHKKHPPEKKPFFPLLCSRNLPFKLRLMDLFASLFGFILLILAVGVTYQWGIKPDREEKKRRAELIRAEMRRQHSEKLRRRADLRSESLTN